LDCHGLAKELRKPGPSTYDDLSKLGITNETLQPVIIRNRKTELGGDPGLLKGVRPWTNRIVRHLVTPRSVLLFLDGVPVDLNPINSKFLPDSAIQGAY
jgi:hypothetical protein